MGHRALAAAITVFAFVGSGAYTVTHPKNASAPLQPEVASPTASVSARATATPRPRITLQPGVRATEVPGITVTHVS